jgi:cell division protein FtsI (penicillin-binding protein 3)
MRVAFLAIAFVLSLFCARLFQLQGVDANAYAAMAQAEGSRTVVLYAARGEILDRSGEALADSVDGVALTADPTQTAEKAPQIAALLTSRLDLDYFATVERLRTPDTQFVYLARQVPRWRGEAIREALLARGLVGVYTERDPLRNYPNGVVAAPVVGRTGADGSGQSGLELAYDETLTGTDGSATYDISVSGERLPVSSSDNEDPQSGQSVQTTLDRDLQWFADVRLAEGVRTTSADWGVAVTMDTRTGQLLQLSQAPGFNPRDDDLSGDELRVKALEDVYEPGSVQKVLTFGALLDSGAIDPDTKITVPGSLPVGGRSCTTTSRTAPGASPPRASSPGRPTSARSSRASRSRTRSCSTTCARSDSARRPTSAWRERPPASSPTPRRGFPSSARTSRSARAWPSTLCRWPLL